MPRPRKKYSIWARIKFLFSGKIQTLRPRKTRAKLERKELDKVETQYNNLTPL